jgi:hypothetical protein
MVFHTPNLNSLKFTRHSTRPVFQMRPRIGIRHAARVALACAQLAKAQSPDDTRVPSGVFRRDAMPVAALFNDRDALAELIAQDAARRGPRLQTARSVEYLYWRYAAHPTIQYYALTIDRGARLEGCLIFRLDRVGAARRLVVQELLVKQPSAPLVRALRQELDVSLDYDLIQYHDSADGWRDLLPSQAVPSWNAFNFTVGMYDPSLGRSGLELDNWSLTLGDLQEI